MVWLDDQEANDILAWDSVSIAPEKLNIPAHIFHDNYLQPLLFSLSDLGHTLVQFRPIKWGVPRKSFLTGWTSMLSSHGVKSSQLSVMYDEKSKPGQTTAVRSEQLR